VKYKKPNIEWERYKWVSDKGTEFEIIREVVENQAGDVEEFDAESG